MQKVYAIILKVWKDPVWSKVISTGFIFLIATLWVKCNHYSLQYIYEKTISFLNFTVPVYLYLILFGIILLIIFLFKKIRNRKNAIWNEQVGNYTFKELYSILLNQNLPVGTVGMGYGGRKPPEDPLLYLFHMNIIFFNSGVTLDAPHDDGGYLYGVLCPALVSYGLIDKIDLGEKHSEIPNIMYQTSLLGHKFYSLLEKIIDAQKKRKNSERIKK